MAIPRRFLPSLSWLTAFEAVARRNSVTQAAAELDLSQGAVSRQIQKLENMLGMELFIREKKRLILTPSGASYAKEVREAIGQISNATIKIHSNPDGGVLELSILPAFGTHWLAPRLPGFLAANPGITINLSTRTVPFDFTQERFHAAIHFGSDDWAGTETIKLMDEEVVPVVSPDLIANAEFLVPLDLVSLPLLHLETRPNGWAQWFQAQGLAGVKSGGMGFDQFATMSKAASHGIGVALLPRYLAEENLENGRFVTLENTQTTSIGAYYLVWPKSHSTYPPLLAFRKWIGRPQQCEHASLRTALQIAKPETYFAATTFCKVGNPIN